MKGVKRLTAEAVAAFVAVMKSESHENVRIGGNLPSDATVARKLDDFGFYDLVNRRWGSVGSAGQRGKLMLKKTQFKIAKDDLVQAEIAGKMVDFAREVFPDSLHKGVYTMFMEATTNTVEHASGTKKPTQWIAGAYYDNERNVMSFTVIDRGVGILNSVKFVRAISSLWGRVTWDAGEKLRQLCHGKMRSSTEEAHRGLGIPGAFAAFQAQRIADLAIICNHGFAHVKENRFLELESSFDGTIIYWEA